MAEIEVKHQPSTFHNEPSYYCLWMSNHHQWRTMLRPYMVPFLKETVYMMASCLPWDPPILRSPVIESDRSRLSGYKLPSLPIMSQPASLSRGLFCLHRISVQQSRCESRPMTKGTAVTSCSWKCGSKQWWVDGYGAGDALSTHLCKEGIMTPNDQVLSAPWGIASAAEKHTPRGGAQPATDPSISKKFQPTHPNQLGPFELQSSTRWPSPTSHTHQSSTSPPNLISLPFLP